MQGMAVLMQVLWLEELAAFLSHRKASMPGKLLDCVPALKLEYLGLSEEDKRHWMRAGNLGRLSAQRGFPAFRPASQENLALPARPAEPLGALPEGHQQPAEDQELQLVQLSLEISQTGAGEHSTLVHRKLQELVACGHRDRKAQQQQAASCLAMVKAFREEAELDMLDPIFAQLLPQLQQCSQPLDAWCRHPNMLPSLGLVRLHLPADYFTEARDEGRG